jgi:hypothetical protein
VGVGVGATSLFADQVPDPFEPVLVYAPESVFQSLLALPVKVVVVPSALLRVITTLFPSKVPLSVALSDVVPEKGSYLFSCVIESFVARTDTLDCVRDKSQVPPTLPWFISS